MASSKDSSTNKHNKNDITPIDPLIQNYLDYHKGLKQVNLEIVNKYEKEFLKLSDFDENAIPLIFKKCTHEADGKYIVEYKQTPDNFMVLHLTVKHQRRKKANIANAIYFMHSIDIGLQNIMLTYYGIPTYEGIGIFKFFFRLQTGYSFYEIIFILKKDESELIKMYNQNNSCMIKFYYSLSGNDKNLLINETNKRFG